MRPPPSARGRANPPPFTDNGGPRYRQDIDGLRAVAILPVVLFHAFPSWIPGGFAHGFQCLTDNCEVFYQMSESYFAELARGLRWNDPQVGIKWPLPGAVLSERDKTLPLLKDLPL